jgi:glycerol kinase
MAAYFHVSNDYYKTVQYNPEIIQQLHEANTNVVSGEIVFKGGTQVSQFASRALNNFFSYEAAYHQLILDIMVQQVASTNLVLHNSPVKKIFVDGGFSKNAVYMNLLCAAFPGKEVYAASIAQATSLGAALAMHQHWNRLPIRSDLIQLRYYADTQPLSL